MFRAMSGCHRVPRCPKHTKSVSSMYAASWPRMRLYHNTDPWRAPKTNPDYPNTICKEYLYSPSEDEYSNSAFKIPHPASCLETALLTTPSFSCASPRRMLLFHGVNFEKWVQWVNDLRLRPEKSGKNTGQAPEKSGNNWTNYATRPLSLRVIACTRPLAPIGRSSRPPGSSPSAASQVRRTNSRYIYL